jgi:hypothetical protein
MSTQERRKRKLIEPRIQKRFVLIFLSATALAVLVQALVVSHLLLGVADRLPSDGLELKGELVGILASGMSFTLVLLTPLTLAVGIASTHKIVGPLYRFRVYLTQLAAGERPAPCKIRKDDELQDFCELLNRATEPLRRSDAAAAAPGEEAA